MSIAGWKHRALCLAGLAGLSFVVASCTNSTFGNDNVFTGIDALESVRDADLSPRTPRANRAKRNLAGGPNGQGRNGRGMVFSGTDQSAGGNARPLFQAASNGKSYDLNLEGANIETAAKVIFSDILNTGYAIDPRVQGQVSFSTGRPIPVDHLLVYFENALRFANAAITKDPLGYRIVPISEADSGIDQGGRNSVRAGYGVSIVPLLHVSADSIVPLIDNFITREGLVKVDKERNALLFQGTAAERRAAIDAVLSFDQEWLSSQSVGIYRVQSTNPQIVIREVSEILKTKEGRRGAGLVQMLPIERLNGVMVVAKTKALLNKTFTWLERLDRNDLNSVGIRVYQVQYAEAAQLASTLNTMFLGGTSSVSPAADAASQFPPDSVQGEGVQTDGAAQSALSSGASVAPPATASSSAEGALLSNVRISSDPTNNTLLIYADNEQYKIIERAIAALDRRPQQVAIETTIAEITLNNELKHGVQFFLKSNDLGLGDDKGSGGLIGAGVDAILDRVVPGFNLLFGPENEPRLIIDALRNLTQVNVLSQPSVVVRDNSVAILQIGDEVPITTQTVRSTEEVAAPIVNSVTFRDTGVILRVKPRISANGEISLDIQQEISSVVENASSNSLTPTISQRKVESTLSVVSGQTVLLGGLISQKENNGSSGLPVLSDINRWGDLFRSRKKTVGRTELILLIRPQIIRNEQDASSVANQMRNRLRLLNGTTPTPLRVPAGSVIQ